MPLSVAGPALGAGFGQVFTLLRDILKDGISKACQFKPILKRLESMLDSVAPKVTDIERLNQQLNRPAEETQSLIEEMTKECGAGSQVLANPTEEFVFNSQVLKQTF